MSSKILLFAIYFLENEPQYRNRYFYKYCNSFNNKKSTIQLNKKDLLKDGYAEIEYNQNHILTNFIDKFNGLPDLKIKGKKISQLFTFENISLWQFVSGVYYADKPQEVIELIEYLSILIQNKSPKTIILQGNYCIHQLRTVLMIAKKHKIEVIYPKKKFLIEKISDFLDQITDFNYVIKKIKLTIYRIVFNHFSVNSKNKDRYSIGLFSKRLNRKLHEKGKNILFLSFERVWTARQNGIDIDQYYDAFKRNLEKIDYHVLRVELPYYLSENLQSYVKELKNDKGGFTNILFDEYYSSEILRKVNKYRRKYLYVFRKYCLNNKFKNLFEWKSFNYFSPLKNYWKNLFVNVLAEEAVSSLLIARKMIKELSPKLLFVLYEAGVYPRAAIIEGQRAGVKTIGLQHGIITKETEFYMQSNQIDKPDFNHFIDGVIAPSKTYVYGQHFIDLLSQDGHYSINSLKAVKEWRYLNINVGDILKKSEDIKKRFFSDKKKILLFLTSYSDEIIADLIKRKVDPNEYNIIIKTHPREKDLGHFKKLFDGSKYNVIVLSNMLYETIAVADIVFTTLYTTVVLDCLAFNKPVFCLKDNFYGHSVSWSNIVYDINDYPSIDSGNSAWREKTQKYLEMMGIDINISDEEIYSTIEEELKDL